MRRQRIKMGTPSSPPPPAISLPRSASTRGPSRPPRSNFVLAALARPACPRRRLRGRCPARPRQAPTAGGKRRRAHSGAVAPPRAERRRDRQNYSFRANGEGPAGRTRGALRGPRRRRFSLPRFLPPEPPVPVHRASLYAGWAPDLPASEAMVVGCLKRCGETGLEWIRAGLVLARSLLRRGKICFFDHSTPKSDFQNIAITSRDALH